jgi:hypothetical protein
MLLAERSMTGKGVADAHKSRVLEYRPAGGGWLLSPAVFEVGAYSNRTNSAGGLDYDYDPTGRNWATGDAIHYPTQPLYGYQGIPKSGTGSGGGTLNSILIDDDGIAMVTKYRNGDLEITCPACNDGGSIGPISGPTTTCTGTATYCVNPQPGVVYNWTITGGTAPNLTGPCITVNWSTGGSLTVTGTKTFGCPAMSATLPVAACQSECCSGVSLTAPINKFSFGGGGAMTFAASVTASMPNVVRVTADLLTTSRTFSSHSCGTAGPANSYFLAALPTNPPSLFTPQPVNPPSGREALWQASSATTVSNIAFPMQIQLPPPPPSPCYDLVSFCIKYSVYDDHCKGCSAVICYGPLSRDPGTIDNH